MQKAIGFDEMHLWVHRELAEKAVKPHTDRKRRNLTLIYKKEKKKDLRNDRPVILTSVSWKIIEQMLLQRHNENKEVIDHNQHSFTK